MKPIRILQFFYGIALVIYAFYLGMKTLELNRILPHTYNNILTNGMMGCVIFFIIIPFGILMIYLSLKSKEK